MVVVAGKGGVGKTTVSAAVACAASRSGRRVVLVDLQGNPALAATFGRPVPFGYAPVSLWAADDGPGSLTARAIDPSVALAEYLEQHGLGRVSKRLITTGVVDVVATAAPGIEDLLVLGKLKQMELSGESDLIVVDGPPAGHAVQFLLAAARLARRRVDRPDRCPGRRRPGAARRSRALRGDPRHAARDHPGQRTARDRRHAARARGHPGRDHDRERLRRGPTDRTARGFAASRAWLQRSSGTSAGHATRRSSTGSDSWRPASESSGCRCCRPPRSQVPRWTRWRRWSDRGEVTGRFRGGDHGARVVVCCGSGGVGKTTTAAAIGLQLARSGVRVVVITIDPAKRLADALGLAAGLSNTPAAARMSGTSDGGELWACMLDTTATFDDLVRDEARHPRAGRRDPRQPLLPQHRRWPVGHRGVHGGGEAAPAARRRPVRRRSSSTRRRAATHSTSWRRRHASPASSTTGCSSC